VRITILLALVIAAVLMAGKLWFWGDRESARSAASPNGSIVAEDSSQGGQVVQAVQELVKGPAAPDIVSSVWLNSPALTAKDLRGNVVVVEFWTHG
jgi:hypothetical protein